MQAVVPMFAGAGIVMLMVGRGSPLLLVAGVVMMFGTIGGGLMMFISRRTGGRRQTARQRDTYLAYLDDQRRALQETARDQAAYAAHAHPDPLTLVFVVRSAQRRFERRVGDADFLAVRVGLGDVPLAVQLGVPPRASPLDLRDEISSRAAETLVQEAATVSNQPLVVPLAQVGTVSVVGAPGQSRPVARAMIMQLAALHSPNDVTLALCVPGCAGSWDWAKWLPHLQDETARDGATARRCAAGSWDALAGELAGELARRREQAERAHRLGGGRVPPGRRLVVVVDELESGPSGRLLDGGSRPAGDLGVTLVRLVGSREEEPEDVDLRITVAGAEVEIERRGAGGTTAGRGIADRVGGADAEALARELAPFRILPDTVEEPLTGTTDLPGMLGIADVAAFDVRSLWAPAHRRDFLRVPIGLRPDGTPLRLDLKESADGGVGPHGLCVGATGSGKSELLRSLVLALAVTHPPERLAFILVDYKGGAAFAGLEALPHVAGMITNLSEDLGLVDRMHDALWGEIKRRQKRLADAGNLPDVKTYNQQRETEPSLPPLPNLLVVVDEFAELLAAKPDFINLFVAIGRIGRSIGVHQLLAAQRLEPGRMRGLEGHISYRIGLKTFTADDSREALGVPDAVDLPPVPGSGYLKVGATALERFKAAYASATYRPVSSPAVDAPARIHVFTLLNGTPREAAAGGTASAQPGTGTAGDPPPAGHQPDPDSGDDAGPKVLDVVAGRLAASAERVHQVWVAPLPAALSLDTVTGPPRAAADGGLYVGGTQWGGLRIPVGIVDRPTEQRQEPFVLDMSGQAGHLAVLGAPRSGKSELLRTLAAAAALTHAPGELAFHCIDFGGSLDLLAGLPHVGTVSGRIDIERVRRTFGELTAELDSRERLFREARIDSVGDMRTRWRAGELPELACGDIFLLLDGYLTIKNDHEDLAAALAEITTRGLSYGIHVVLTATRWSDLRPTLQTTIAGRLEMRLTDPLDSVIDRKKAAAIPPEQPGRCLTSDARLAHAALARVDGVAGTDGLAKALTDLGRTITDSWPARAVPGIRLLPTLITLDQVRRHAADDTPTGESGGRIPIGIDERRLQPVWLDLLGADQHLIVFGEDLSGRTNLLRTVIRGCQARWTPKEVVFAVVDPRRTLLQVVPESYRGAYAPTAAAAEALARSLAKELTGRLPGPEIGIQQLQDRSWWHGPEIILIVDDLDHVSSGQQQPFTPLIGLLPQSRDIGLHVILARHSGGAGRAVFEPFLQRLKELQATGFVLSGDPQEPALWPGVRPAPRPPGRGTLVRRRQPPAVVQLAWTENEAHND
jgi:S-DNA-T family DNA segregation ATPase FtsK/SpoIIIE